MRFLSFFDSITQPTMCSWCDFLRTGGLSECKPRRGTRVQLQVWVIRIFFRERKKGYYRNTEGHCVGRRGRLCGSDGGRRHYAFRYHVNKPWPKCQINFVNIFIPWSSFLCWATARRFHWRHQLHLGPSHASGLHRFPHDPIHVQEGVNVRSSLRFHLGRWL